MLEADQHKLLPSSNPFLFQQKDESVNDGDVLGANNCEGISNVVAHILHENSNVTSNESNSVVSSVSSAKQEKLIINENFRIPPPRCSALSKIQFTPRVFPTPSRESKAGTFVPSLTIVI
jgi:hypothetical protein